MVKLLEGAMDRKDKKESKREKLESKEVRKEKKMAKNEKKEKSGKVEEETKTVKPNKAFAVEEAAVDPTLAALFASSAGPVQAPPKARYDGSPPPLIPKRLASTAAEINGGSDEASEADSVEHDDDDEELSSIEGDLEDADIDMLNSDDDGDVGGETEAPDPVLVALENEEGRKTQNKRKRKSDVNEDDIEGQYLLKLQREEEKEEEERQAERRLKRQRLGADQGNNDVEGRRDSVAESDTSIESNIASLNVKSLGAPDDVPVHESLAPVQDKEITELEKASRTVFLANVSTACITDKSAHKELLNHMASFLGDLDPPKDSKTTHKIESVRFRSTAYANDLPKKASFATKNLMDATTKSTNAYLVYSTSYAAREAVKRLNATVVLERHLRVDGVAHPAKTDHRRCVFVGNLGYVDDESMQDQLGEGQRKRSKIPSDVEEGLWSQFSKAGKVESVRVVRDEKTRVGKGFAYVQFEDANSVEAALLFHEKKYPPMLPRLLRVTRAKAMAKTALASQKATARPQRLQPGGASNPNNQAIYNPKMSAQQQSLQGRASKLLGKAGAAQIKKHDSAGKSPRPGMEGLKTPENVVMEGYRASAKNGKPKDLKFGKKKKPAGNRGKRASDWKKGGGKKAKA